jgi:threonine 3-dehydrogenase
MDKKTMSGVIKERPGPGAAYRTDLPMPEVGPNDVLVKVRAAAICGTDLHILPWTPYAAARFKPPMVFGHEFAGDIVEVGANVSECKAGDRVAGETHIPCNECYQCKTDNRHICNDMKIIGVHAPGAFAEYIAFPKDCVYKLPESLSYEAGAMLEPMGVGVHGASAAKVKGENVVVYGCGPIGAMGVGACKAWGAKRIVAVDVFDDKLKIAKAMGADVTVNANRTDAANEIIKIFDGAGADVIIDYSGNVAAIRAEFKALRKGGRLALVGLPGEDITLNLCDDIIYKEATVIGVTGRLMYQTWEECAGLLNTRGFSLDPVFGGTYPLKDFEKAFADINAGKPGKMILIP